MHLNSSIYECQIRIHLHGNVRGVGGGGDKRGEGSESVEFVESKFGNRVGYFAKQYVISEIIETLDFPLSAMYQVCLRNLTSQLTYWLLLKIWIPSAMGDSAMGSLGFPVQFLVFFFLLLRRKSC